MGGKTILARTMAIDKQKTSAVAFGYLDRTADIDVRDRNLPHWFQPGAAMFVTWRTADSLPKDVILRWQRELEDWLSRNDLPLAIAESVVTGRQAVGDLTTIPTAKRNAFRQLSDRIWHRSLDKCHGKCLLKNPALAEIVGKALLHFDGERYDLDCLVVMPNHVHVIVQFRSEMGPATIGQSWMRYTARQINAQTGQSGAFWQPEPFDHIIRTGEQFEYLQRYIAANPRQAKLRSGEFLYWTRASL